MCQNKKETYLNCRYVTRSTGHSNILYCEKDPNGMGKVCDHPQYQEELRQEREQEQKMEEEKRKIRIPPKPPKRAYYIAMLTLLLMNNVYAGDWLKFMPDHPMYGIQKWYEQVEVAISPKEARTQVLLKQVEKRQREISYLQQRQKYQESLQLEKEYLNQIAAIPTEDLSASTANQLRLQKEQVETSQKKQMSERNQSISLLKQKVESLKSKCDGNTYEVIPKDFSETIRFVVEDNQEVVLEYTVRIQNQTVNFVNGITPTVTVSAYLDDVKELNFTTEQQIRAMIQAGKIRISPPEKMFEWGIKGYTA
jgi:hypothetical protein